MKNFRRIILAIVALNITNCSQAGWKGYYETYPRDGNNKYIAESAINSTPIKIKNEIKVDLNLPRDCSGFALSGLFTPITPPIPLFWLRSWSKAECHFFTVKTKPETNVKLIVKNKIYESTKVKDLYGYTKYIFPIRAKNLDFGILIVEKDGEKIEVPFEYKYFKFWY